jgi:cysteine-rich repeat protein
MYIEYKRQCKLTQSMRIYILLVYACMVNTQSEFWTKARQTLTLSNLRVNITRQPYSVNNSIISLPQFMPLCGNGRVDTKDDYIAYYRGSNLPLTMTTQQILYMYRGLSNPSELHNISFTADEECDDGNRIDFDGCSADCMSLDLWTSPCELAVDLKLEYEDLIYDTVRQSMVVSASSGIYSLDPNIDSASLTARLIAPKSFQVTDIFRNSTSLILYSEEQQAFWQLVDGASTITLLKNIKNISKWTQADIHRHCHQNPDGSVVVYDKENMFYLPTLTSDSYSACSYGMNVSACTFAQYQPSGAALFTCDGVSIEIGSGICMILHRPGIKENVSLYLDVFNKISYATFTQKSTIVNSYSVSPLTDPITSDISFEVYHPMGGFMQGVFNPARNLGGLSLSLGVFYFTGDKTLLDMITVADNLKTCGLDRCIFDNDRGYDIFDPNPLKNAQKQSWNDLLQAKISEEASITPPLNDLAAIQADPQRYERLLNAFTATFLTIISPLIALAIQKHPVTLNTWAIRKDRLIEISKSGVQLKRVDGKCIPSGVALCGDCQWAPNGRECRPCAQADATSWSWNMKCKSCKTGRRLLAGGTTTISFVLSGDLAAVLKVWAFAAIDPATKLITVTIDTTDPVAEMRSVQQKLLSAGFQVITRPYVVIRVGPEAAAIKMAFTLRGNFSSVQSVWPNAVNSASGLITVEIETKDPEAELRNLLRTLVAMTGVEMVTPPYIVVQSEPPIDPGIITAAVLVPCLAVLAGVLIYVFTRSNHAYEPVYPHPGPYPGSYPGTYPYPGPDY